MVPSVVGDCFWRRRVLWDQKCRPKTLSSSSDMVASTVWRRTGKDSHPPSADDPVHRIYLRCITFHLSAVMLRTCCRSVMHSVAHGQAVLSWIRGRAISAILPVRSLDSPESLHLNAVLDVAPEARQGTSQLWIEGGLDRDSGAADPEPARSIFRRPLRSPPRRWQHQPHCRLSGELSAQPERPVAEMWQPRSPRAQACAGRNTTWPSQKNSLRQPSISE